MKAVNQSIGRSIRHSGDYAAIVLMDERFQNAKITGKLSNWIQRRYRPGGQFSTTKELIETFFKSKQK